MAVALSTSDLDFEYPDSAPETAKGPGPSDPFDPDEENTMDKIACIEEMINRMEDMPSPSDVFLRGILNEVKKDDVHKMVDAQTHMLSRFEKTNEMLLNFNSLSTARYEATHQEFRRHTQLLTEMKRDLDSVFRRIRTLKSKLAKQHPGAFNAASSSTPLTEVDEEEEDRPKSTSPQVAPRRAKPPRPSQPPMRRASSSSPRSANRHSWAGAPTNIDIVIQDSSSPTVTPPTKPPPPDIMSKSESAVSSSTAEPLDPQIQGTSEEGTSSKVSSDGHDTKKSNTSRFKAENGVAVDNRNGLMQRQESAKIVEGEDDE